MLPFLAAVDGYLREDGDVPGLRITVQRAMSRKGRGYLQQVCAYLREAGGDWRGKVGRFFAVDTGIIGAAYENGRVWRTKRFQDVDELNEALAKDKILPEAVARSWLAVPFLGPQDQVVLILYADCLQLNFFADDARAKRIVAMSRGFVVFLIGCSEIRLRIRAIFRFRRASRFEESVVCTTVRKALTVLIRPGSRRFPRSTTKPGQHRWWLGGVTSRPCRHLALPQTEQGGVRNSPALYRSLRTRT